MPKIDLSDIYSALSKYIAMFTCSLYKHMYSLNSQIFIVFDFFYQL
jgi:hypothetical protein